MTDRSDSPEPEFFFMLILASVIFAVCTLIAIAIHGKGRRANSKILQWLAMLPLGCGLMVFAPMFLMLLLWICYWIFGSNSPAPPSEP